MKKKITNIKSEFSVDIFNLFVYIALAPVDLATRLPFYPLNIVVVILITSLWAFPMFLFGSILSSVIKITSMFNKLIKGLIYGN